MARTAKQAAAAKANLEKARRKKKRGTITKARKANQADVAFQKANPGGPVVRLSSRPRYDSSGQLRVKGAVGSRLRKGLSGGKSSGKTEIKSPLGSGKTYTISSSLVHTKYPKRSLGSNRRKTLGQ